MSGGYGVRGAGPGVDARAQPRAGTARPLLGRVRACWLRCSLLRRGDGIGASDCELVRDATLAQPVNALTSLAYVVAGAVVIASARRRHRPFVAAMVFGSCVIAIGIGSVLFHGPQPAGSRLLHDLPIVVTVLFVLVHDLDVVCRLDPRRVRRGRRSPPESPESPPRRSWPPPRRRSPPP